VARFGIPKPWSLTHVYAQKLNLSSLSHLKSSDLEPLFPSESDPSTSPLQILILNNTGLGDDAAPFIGSCQGLETLGVASTKFTSAITVQPFTIYFSSDDLYS
jgi:hypothetical protein